MRYVIVSDATRLRLPLPPHGSAELRVLYVAVPELGLSVSRQRYTRLAERRYRYASLDSGFSAEKEGAPPGGALPRRPSSVEKEGAPPGKALPRRPSSVELEVDEDGLVTEYPGFCRMVPP